MFLSLIKSCYSIAYYLQVSISICNDNENVCLRLKCSGENALPAWLGIDAIEWYYRWRLPVALRRSSALRCTAAPAWRLLESRAVRVTSPDETRLSGEFHNERQRNLSLPRNSRSTSMWKKKKNATKNARPRYFLVRYPLLTYF